MPSPTIKKYVGYAGDAIADVWRAIRAERDVNAEAEPPVGAKDTFKGAPTAVVAGIPIGTLMLIGLAWFFLRGR